jgi:D-alanyl-D-alanine carboxypeptidase
MTKITQSNPKPARAIAAIALGVLMVAVLWAQGAMAGAIVINAQTGAILFADDADRSHYPASLTKMMTLYMTFDALATGPLRLSQSLPVSSQAARQVPSKIGLRTGATISVEDAILALVTKSANDAAVVLAEVLGGTESNFAVGMTMKARDLGLHRTTFRNASGLHDRYQHTTPRDMANLAIALIRDFPQYYGYFSTTSFTYQGTTYTNHNNLLGRYPGTDGLKTGYVRSAGYNLAASVVRDQTRLVGVVLGGDTAADRDRAMANLFDTAFMRLHILRPSPVPPMVEVAELAPPAVLPPSPRSPVLPAPASALLPGVTAEAAPAITPDVSEWSVQVGAYRGYDGAQRRLQEATLALPLGYLHARPEIEPSADDALYHARLVGLTQSEANNACRILEPAGVPCIVMPQRSMAGAAAVVPLEAETGADAEEPSRVDRATAIADVLRMLLPLRPNQ